VSNPTSPTSPRFEPLAWDTAHFGMAVGRIAGEVREPAELGPLLTQARAAGAELVYYLHLCPFALAAELLAQHGGQRITGYVRFARTLTPAQLPAPEPIPGIVLASYLGPADDARVLALGVGAGWLSRFRSDRRLPPQKCDELYEIWTHRSILGELADETLVAQMGDEPVGLVTYRAHGAMGEIGLVGMAPSVRGRGIGSALLTHAHLRMAERGLLRAEVVTQTENEGACRLYRRAGYAPAVEGAYYHFHLTAG
jgi:dTDP-4-amino-4,6-dideoxy-D-galactose acyltransferase